MSVATGLHRRFEATPFLLPFSPCGRRSRVAPNEGSLRGDRPLIRLRCAKPPSRVITLPQPGARPGLSARATSSNAFVTDLLRHAWLPAVRLSMRLRRPQAQWCPASDPNAIFAASLIPCASASLPSYATADRATGLADGRSCHAYAINAGPARTAADGYLRDHIVRRRERDWRGCHGLR